MDERGLTESVGRRDGYLITKLGTEELAHAHVRDKIGFVISKIEVLDFKTTLNPHTLQDDLPVNISLFPKAQLKNAEPSPFSEICAGMIKMKSFPEEDWKGGENDRYRS